jgi:hypothetical protein
MNRRYFLAATLSLGALGALTMVGCGGGGNTGGGTTTTLTGRAILPAGISLTGLQIRNLYGRGAMRGDGTFPVTVLEGGPTLSMVIGPTGKPLLFGFVTEGKTDLSARTTAEVMAFLCCGAPCMPSELRPVYLTELARTDRLVGLEKAISDQITAKGEAWLDTPDVTLLAVLNEDIKPFLSQKTRGAIIDPTDVVSGIQVESDGIGSTTLTNYFRRRAYVYIDRESYTDSNKVEHPSFATITTEPISLSPTKGQTSVLPILFDWLTGNNDAYLPVKSDPVSLPVTPSDARTTLYTVTAVGLGAAPGAFDKLTTERQKAWLDAALRTLIIDLVVPAITGILIPEKGVKDWLDIVASSAWLKDLISYAATVPDLVTKVKSGQYAEAGKDIKYFVFGTERFKNGLLELLEIFVSKLGGTTGAEAFTAMSEAVDRVLAVPDLFVQAFDTVTQLIGIARSQNAAQWQVTVTKAKVTLDPLEILVEKGGVSDSIKASVRDVQADAGSAFAYAWKCGTGRLSDGIKPEPARSFESSSDSVTYDGNVPGGTIDQVDVQVFLKGLGKQEPVGSASARVYVSELTVAPTTKTLKSKESLTLTTELKGIRPLKTGEKITYKWLTTRNAGELLGSDDGGTNIPVETPTATYQAHETREGVDTITVEAFLGSVRVGSAKARVTVGKNSITVAGRWFVETKAAEGQPGRTSVRALLMVPKIEDAKSYSVYCHDFNDTAYYGTTIRRGWNMPGLPSDWGDFGSEFAFGLSGGVRDDTDVGAYVAGLTSRFQGMIVEVTVTL